MQNVSNDFLTIMAGEHKSEIKFTIGNQTVTSANIFTCNITKNLFSENKLSIGGCSSSQLSTVLLVGDYIIGEGSIIYVWLRVFNNNSTSEWVTKGKFWVEKIKTKGLRHTITATDIVTKLDCEFNDGTLTFPMSGTSAILGRISECIGFSGNVLCTNFQSNILDDVIIHDASEVEGMTVRDVAGKLAELVGANWIADESSNLILKPLFEGSEVELSGEYFDKDITDTIESIDKVTFVVNNTTTYSKGWGGNEIVLENQWATQDAANATYQIVSSSSYIGHCHDTAFVNPAVQLGDFGVNSAAPAPLYFSKIDEKLGSTYSATLAADSNNTAAHSYKGTYQKQIEKKVELNKDYYGVTTSADKGLIISRSDGKSEAVFNSDEFRMSSIKDNIMTPAIYFNTITGKYRITGNVEIDGDLLAQMVVVNDLYSSNGNVANMAVSKLRTDYDRIAKYLSGDTSDIYHVVIEGDEIKLIHGVNSGGVTTYTDSDGNNFYWTDESHTHMTTEVTSYPVYTYQYDEEVSGEFSFEDIDGNRVAVLGFTNGENSAGILLSDNGLITTNTGVDGLRNVCFSTSPPTSPVENHIWVDTTAEPFLIYGYVGGTWKHIGGSGGGVQNVVDLFTSFDVEYADSGIT